MMRILVQAVVLALVCIPRVVICGDIQTDGKFVSTDPTNPPMAVSSSSLVSNFNADMVDGFDANDFVTFTDTAYNSDLLDGYDTATIFSAAAQIYVSGINGKLPLDTVDDDSIEDVTREFFFGANQLEASFSSAPPTANILAVTPVYDFSDSVINRLGFTIQVPSDWDGQSNLEMRLLWCSVSTLADVFWGAGFNAVAENEPVNKPFTTLPGVVSTSSSMLRGRVRTSPFQIPAADLQSGDLMTIAFYRDPNESSDVLVGNASFVGVEISYVALR